MYNLQYIVLHILVILICCWYCKKASYKEEKNYWKLATIPIMVFTFEEGLRWGRHIDWCAYYYVYNSLGTRTNTTEIEYLFELLWGTMARLGFPYYVAISLCSFLLVYSFFKFAKPYKQLLFLFLPLSIIWIAPAAMNMVRWYMGFSIALIGLRYLLDGCFFKSILLFIAASLFHTITGVLMLPCLLFYVFKKVMFIRPKYVVLISVFFVLFFNVASLANLFGLLSVFSSLERYSGYIANADSWFASTGGLDGFNRKANIVYIATMVPFYASLLYTYKNRKIIPNASFFYNVLTFCVILRSFSSGMEIVARIATFYDFSFLYLCSWFLYKQRFIKSMAIVVVIVWASIAYKAFIFIRPMSNDALNHYIWNSGNISPEKAFYLCGYEH